MTNAEFLDDVARRAQKGDLFTGAERCRLFELCGYFGKSCRDKYMKNAARNYVRIARVQLVVRCTKRIKEAV